MATRFRITANMVTMARILLLPIPCAFLLYGGKYELWIAFFLYTLLGATDFVDGAMARREGPTKLGGLIDPVADKIFVASICLALVAIKLMPVWALVAILLRELFITALRSSVAFRAESIRTSVLAKVKTMVQMGGFGTIFLSIGLTPLHATIVAALLFTGIMVFYALYWLNKKKQPPFWVLPVAASFLYWMILSLTVSPQTSVICQLVVIVALTWISCIDYVVGTYKMFLRTGITSKDWVRLFWSAVHTVVAAPLVVIYPVLVLPILLSISFELALGGVDMVVASEQKYAGKLPFVATSLMAVIASILIFLNYKGFIAAPVILIASLLAAVSFAAFSFTFVKWRFLFRRALGMI